MQKYAMWFKVIAVLAAMTLLSGCVSNKSEEKKTVYATEKSLGSYLVTLNSTTPVETNVNSTIGCMKISTSLEYLNICLYDVGKGNDTDNHLEKVIQNLVWEYSWFKAGIRYKYLSKTEINGYQGILVIGNPKFEPEEVLAAYYPLPGTMMVVHSTFNVQETRDILNTTIVKRI